MIYTELTKKAINIAYTYHNGQIDKSGIPYVFHPYHLAEQMDDEYSVCVALLHDIIEDTDYPIEQLKNDFPEPICNAVILLTRNKEMTYIEYIEKLKNNELAKKIKIADLNHNLDNTRCSIKSSLIERYKKALEILK